MKKNLIIFYPSFEKGGVTKILINLLKSKNNTKYNFHIISTECPLKKKEMKKNFFFYRIHKHTNSYFIPQRFITAFRAMIKLFCVLNRLDKRTIVHSMQSNIAAIIICFFKNIKVIIRNSENPIYSTLNTENKFFGLIIFFMKLVFYNFSNGIITNSRGSAKSLSFFVFNKKKIKQIYNPYLKKINFNQYKKEKIVLNIARLRKQKDHDTLIKAFEIFLKKNKSYKLLILGHGNLKKKLTSLAHNLNIRNKVIFKGWVKDTFPYLKKSKIFVLSSVYEGLGNVLIDAINFNTPCISTNCPSGPSEILLNGKGGFLVEPKSPHLLAEKMNFCVKDYKKSLFKNKLAKSKLNRFLIEQNTNKYFEYLNSFY
jgi:glycosyltransferase involved in cell wall biosynthesis